MALLLSLCEKRVSYLQKEIRRELLVAYQRYLNAFVAVVAQIIGEPAFVLNQFIKECVKVFFHIALH